MYLKVLATEFRHRTAAGCGDADFNEVVAIRRASVKACKVVVNPEPDVACPGHRLAIHGRGTIFAQQDAKVHRGVLNENSSVSGYIFVSVIGTGEGIPGGPGSGSNCRCSQVEAGDIGYLNDLYDIPVIQAAAETN